MVDNKYLKQFKDEIDKLAAQLGGDWELNEIKRDNVLSACKYIIELNEEIGIVDYDAAISDSGAGIILSLICNYFEIMSGTSSFYTLIDKATRVGFRHDEDNDRVCVDLLFL